MNLTKRKQAPMRHPRHFLITKYLSLVAVDARERCWIARRLTPTGYGKPIRDGARVLTAQRAAYELFHGSIPSGAEIDHVCGNRACGNPHHLEAVSHAENCRRAAERRVGAQPEVRSALAAT